MQLSYQMTRGQIMKIFDNQMEERKKADQELLEDSFIQIAGVLLGQHQADRMEDQRITAKNAIEEILKYYHFKPAEVSEAVTDFHEVLDYCLRPHGIMRRDVELTKGWYKECFGPLLGFWKEKKTPVALIPGKITGYFYIDPETNTKCRINKKTAEQFETDAICFYRPLPSKPIKMSDLILYMRNCVTRFDNVMILLITLALTAVGLLLPSVTRAITGPVLSSGRTDAVIGIAICILCIALTSQLISISKGLIAKRISTMVSLGIQASMVMRLISLPASFFREHSPGELQSRLGSIQKLCNVIMQVAMSAGIMALISLLYILQIFHFTPSLVLPSVIMILANIILTVVTTNVQVRINKKQMEQAAVESAMSFSLISGIQKIKLAGAEKRALGKWMKIYARGLKLNYDPPLLIKVSSVLSTAITLIGTIVIYYIAVRTQLDPSSYFAFTAAFGAVMGALSELGTTAFLFSQIEPMMQTADPFLKTIPEFTENKEVVTSISGSVELNHVWFRYSEDMPYIARDLSLKIKNGDYVAICGKTGCGKSTLIRLLLGFEKPERGAVLFDGKNIESLEKRSLRRKIGTVLQDGKLFTGDIYSNIVITAPQLSQDDAWEAAEIAGIADDIRKMPMGMNTILSEGGGGVSGGQKQRIMIARAVAPKPRLLIMDEATSALDNKTQKQVSEALDKMGCTRIIIAHRLSTIRHCNRILVLDKGEIAEDGTYEELIARDGLFAELVERQRLDAEQKNNS